MTINNDPGSWKPLAIPADEFHRDEWVNINRSPLDIVLGVIYKRAVSIKSVEYNPLDPAIEQEEPWRGQGKTVVRWLFSEQPQTAEHLLEGTRFAYLHDVTLDPGSSTGHVMRSDVHEVIYVIAGEGILHHRGGDNPYMARPLREGDAVIIQSGEYHSLANPHAAVDLRLLVLGLYRGQA
jgi:quercetin dioxygenase-like cupin family protein